MASKRYIKTVSHRNENPIHSSIRFKEKKERKSKMKFCQSAKVDGALALVDRMYSGKLARLYSLVYGRVRTWHNDSATGRVLFFPPVKRWWRHLYIKGVVECLDLVRRWRQFPSDGATKFVGETATSSSSSQMFFIRIFYSDVNQYSEKGKSLVHSSILICNVKNVRRLTERPQ